MRNTDRQVLIVDDYNTMRRILRNLSGQIGFANVEEAEDGPAVSRCCATEAMGWSFPIGTWSR